MGSAGKEVDGRIVTFRWKKARDGTWAIQEWIWFFWKTRLLGFETEEEAEARVDAILSSSPVRWYVAHALRPGRLDEKKDNLRQAQEGFQKKPEWPGGAMNEARYKLRAECMDDVVKLLALLPTKISWFRIEAVVDESGTRYPDVLFEFKSDLSRNEIIGTLRLMDDAHVMYQTVQPLEAYTGERDFGIE